MDNRPKVGIGVHVIKDGKVLFGKRKNAHGEGDWCLPGGHLEYGESWEECSRREVMEETGIEIKNIRFLGATNDLFAEDQKHYITLFMVADHASGEVELREPQKCERWDWFEWSALPEPLFLPEVHFLKQGINPFDF